MLKLNSVLFMVILCGGLQLSHGEKLKCEFKDEWYYIVGTLYTCYVTSLDNSFNNIVIDGYTGVHMASKNDKDVKAIQIYRTNTKYIPEGLGSLSNLTALLFQSSQVVEIRSKDFRRMQNLEYLGFNDNKFTIVPSDAFSSLPKLKIIYLDSNQIKYIGSGVFDQLTNLNEVYLQSNICVNKYYYGATAITQMKHDIKANCLTSVEWMLIQMEKNFINEVAKANEKNQGELKALNEMMKQLLIESKDHKMEHQENIKLKAELSAAKEEQKMAMDQQKKEQEANTKVINKRDQLEMELTEAKSIIDQKLPKMEQLIEDFYMEVMDLKFERHNERQNSIGLRSKLMEANEQIAECQINERISC